MRTLVPLVVVGIGAFLFGALMPEDTSPAEAFVGLFVIMLVVGGLGWHTRLLDRLGP
jgi:hypothetical protein